LSAAIKRALSAQLGYILIEFLYCGSQELDTGQFLLTQSNPMESHPILSYQKVAGIKSTSYRLYDT